MFCVQLYYGRARIGGRGRELFWRGEGRKEEEGEGGVEEGSEGRKRARKASTHAVSASLLLLAICERRERERERERERRKSLTTTVRVCLVQSALLLPYEILHGTLAVPFPQLGKKNCCGPATPILSFQVLVFGDLR